MKKMLMMGFLMASLLGCSDDADIASYNLSKDADNFKVYRRVVFINGITGDNLLSIEGYCSVEFYLEKVTVTVKTDDGRYLKHYLGKADNVFPVIEQLDAKYVSDKSYKITYKPSQIIPNIEMR